MDLHLFPGAVKKSEPAVQVSALHARVMEHELTVDAAPHEVIAALGWQLIASRNSHDQGNSTAGLVGEAEIDMREPLRPHQARPRRVPESDSPRRVPESDSPLNRNGQAAVRRVRQSEGV